MDQKISGYADAHYSPFDSNNTDQLDSAQSLVRHLTRGRSFRSPVQARRLSISDSLASEEKTGMAELGSTRSTLQVVTVDRRRTSVIDPKAAKCAASLKHAGDQSLLAG